MLNERFPVHYRTLRAMHEAHVAGMERSERLLRKAAYATPCDLTGQGRLHQDELTVLDSLLHVTEAGTLACLHEEKCRMSTGKGDRDGC